MAVGKGRILSRWKSSSSFTCASKPSDLKVFAAGMGVVPWVQHGHPVFKFRHELKYLTEGLGVTFTVEQPLSLNGLNRATQSTANVKLSARLCIEKATETREMDRSQVHLDFWRAAPAAHGFCCHSLALRHKMERAKDRRSVAKRRPSPQK